MTLEEMLNDLPKACDKGGKKDSKGNSMYWNGYKLHLDTIDGGIPVSAIVTSASVHDSGFEKASGFNDRKRLHIVKLGRFRSLNRENFVFVKKQFLS